MERNDQSGVCAFRLQFSRLINLHWAVRWSATLAITQLNILMSSGDIVSSIIPFETRPSVNRWKHEPRTGCLSGQLAMNHFRSRDFHLAFCFQFLPSPGNSQPSLRANYIFQFWLLHNIYNNFFFIIFLSVQTRWRQSWFMFEECAMWQYHEPLKQSLFTDSNASWATVVLRDTTNGVQGHKTWIQFPRAISRRFSWDLRIFFSRKSSLKTWFWNSFE